MLQEPRAVAEQIPLVFWVEEALPEKSVIGLLLCAPSVFSVPLWLFFLSNR